MTLDIESFRTRIRDELTRLEASLSDAEASASTVVLDQSSVGRLSRMDAMQQQAMAQGLHARLVTQRRGLQAALQRIEGGTFGRCCECDADLDPQRLMLDPAAVFCPDCVSDRESR